MFEVSVPTFNKIPAGMILRRLDFDDSAGRLTLDRESDVRVL